ncbi:MAG: hypothetical protein ACXADW_08635 [Candidatus Hodarchaeales archaeon]|jgi:conjugal transfer/entry exclusion protein
MSNGQGKEIKQEGAQDMGVSLSTDQVVQAMTKGQPNGRNIFVQVATLLTSIGVLGGGGYFGLDLIKSELEHTSQSVNAVVQSVDEIKPLINDVKHLQKQVDELRSDFKGLDQLKTEILDRISLTEDKVANNIEVVRNYVIEKLSSVEKDLDRQIERIDKELGKELVKTKDEIYRELRKVKDDVMVEIRNIRDRLSTLEATIKSMSSKQ